MGAQCNGYKSGLVIGHHSFARTTFLAMLLCLAGDIQTNPGPALKNSQHLQCEYQQSELVFDFGDELFQTTSGLTVENTPNKKKDLHRKCPEGQFNISQNGISIAAFSVQRYTNNGSPDVLFVIETFLNATYTDNEIAITGYMLTVEIELVNVVVASYNPGSN